MTTEWLKIDNFKFDKCTECIDELKNFPHQNQP